LSIGNPALQNLRMCVNSSIATVSASLIEYQKSCCMEFIYVGLCAWIL